MLNLRHIEIFHAIMRTGSMTAAAQALNISQPAVSAVLKHFESRLQMPLFKRVGGRLKPTPEALALLPDIAEIFTRLDAIERFSRDLAGGSTLQPLLRTGSVVPNRMLDRWQRRRKRGRRSLPEIWPDGPQHLEG